MHATLVIMAAGMGSRYGGNKQVDGVGPNGENLMKYGCFDAIRAGFDKIVFIIKPEIQELMEKLCGADVRKMKTADGNNVEVCYAYQDFSSIPSWYHIPEGRTKPFGTCHAVLCAREFIHEPFCVINADDYYGVDAYQKIYDELSMMPPEGNATMVGYLLKNTVTEHGTVSRGVCKISEHKLTSIKETLKIQLYSNGSIAELDGDKKLELDPESIVSMNFWGFMPSILNEMQQYFYDFLKTQAPDATKGECYVPNFVGKMVQEGKLNVSVLSSKDRWFGMTYHEDREEVRTELKKLHDTGVYPEKLS